MTSIGDEFLGPTPQIAVGDADAAIRFYREAFGADPMGHIWSLATPVDDLSPGGQNLRARAWVLTQNQERD
jgi:catechol 2,3-dioxygenase-like lactoylglutathione lyase family enzyme